MNIPDLGDGTSYLVEADFSLTSTGSIIIAPGVSFIFKSNTGITHSSTGVFKALGTVDNPITFDSEEGTIGSRDGKALLDGTYQMEYCTITNGGQNAYIGYSAANVVFATGSSVLTYPQTLYKFDNNTVSNSVGAGTTVGLSKYNPLIDNTTNTFTGNISQDSDGDGTPDDGEIGGCENDPDC